VSLNGLNRHSTAPCSSKSRARSLISLSGDEDDWNLLPTTLQFLLKAGSGHSGHSNVEDQTSGLADAIGREKLFRRRERASCKPRTLSASRVATPRTDSSSSTTDTSESVIFIDFNRFLAASVAACRDCSRRPSNPRSARNGEMKTRLGGSPSKDAPLQWRALYVPWYWLARYQDQHGG